MDAKEPTPSQPFTCMHEEQIQGISRKIERIDAELGYKREKLDEIKEDNRRMETKIDEIKDCMNKIMLKSKTDDDQIQNRLTAIETRLDTQEKVTKDNRDNTNYKIGVVAFILIIIEFALKYIH